MANVKRRWLGGALSLLVASQTDTVWAAEGPSAADALKLTPVQKDVDFERPTNTTGATIKNDLVDGKSGWVVRDAAGNILRRFLDTNSDNIVDQWCYYDAGIEVYRDIDSNFDGKADQYRWLNTAGSRWGIDKDQDGRVDTWKTISAEEVTAEVVRAIGDRDVARFNRLLITADEIHELGLSEKQSADLTAITQGAGTKFRESFTAGKGAGNTLASAGNKLKWLHFGGSMPGLVPAGYNGSTKDIIAYENVIAMVDNDGKHDQVPIGTLVKVSDSWRLIDAPRESADQLASSGFFFKGNTPTNVPPEKPKTAEELDAIDVQIAKSAPADLPKLHAKRADVVEKLAEASMGEEKTSWYRQLADTVSVAAQSGNYPDGPARLKDLATKFAESDKDLEAYFFFRYLTSDYYSKIQDPKVDYAKVQAEWLQNLDTFVKNYPKSNDAAEALLQLGIAEEFAGQEEAAKKWYTQAAAFGEDLPPVKKAAGAVVRLNAIGRVLNFGGTAIDGKTPVNTASFKGKVVVLHYWASWCQPFLADMAVLREAQAKYAKDLVIVGINLDENKDEAEKFLRQNKLPWTHLWDQGGLDSKLANSLGIVTVPTVMLIDKQGRVVDRGIHVTLLDKAISSLLK